MVTKYHGSFFEDGSKLKIPSEIIGLLIVTGNKFNHANDPQTSRKIVYVYFYCVHERRGSTDARILHDFFFVHKFARQQDQHKSVNITTFCCLLSVLHVLIPQSPFYFGFCLFVVFN